ncbi:MAG TPA: hypothetical protein VGD59_10525 [Acidisarcina sp.]
MDASPPRVSAGSDDLQSWAERVLLALPEARVTWRAGRPTFTVQDKIFAFTGGRGGTVIKLPEPRARALVASEEAVVLTMGKRAMREWIVVPPTWTEAHLELLRQAAAYVTSLVQETRVPAPKQKRQR